MADPHEKGKEAAKTSALFGTPKQTAYDSGYREPSSVQKYNEGVKSGEEELRKNK